MIVFSKLDLLEKKLKRYSFSEVYPECKTNQVEDCILYVKQLFCEASQKHPFLYFYKGNFTNLANIQQLQYLIKTNISTSLCNIIDTITIGDSVVDFKGIIKYCNLQQLKTVESVMEAVIKLYQSSGHIGGNVKISK